MDGICRVFFFSCFFCLVLAVGFHLHLLYIVIHFFQLNDEFLLFETGMTRKTNNGIYACKKHYYVCQSTTDTAYTNRM